MHPPLPHGRVFCLQVVFSLYLALFNNSYIYRILYTGYSIYGVKYVYADGIHVFCPHTYFTP